MKYMPYNKWSVNFTGDYTTNTLDRRILLVGHTTNTELNSGYGFYSPISLPQFETSLNYLLYMRDQLGLTVVLNGAEPDRALCDEIVLMVYDCFKQTLNSSNFLTANIGICVLQSTDTIDTNPYGTGTNFHENVMAYTCRGLVLPYPVGVVESTDTLDTITTVSPTTGESAYTSGIPTYITAISNLVQEYNLSVDGSRQGIQAYFGYVNHDATFNYSNLLEIPERYITTGFHNIEDDVFCTPSQVAAIIGTFATFNPYPYDATLQFNTPTILPIPTSDSLALTNNAIMNIIAGKGYSPFKSNMNTKVVTCTNIMTMLVKDPITALDLSSYIYVNDIFPAYDFGYSVWKALETAKIIGKRLQVNNQGEIPLLNNFKSVIISKYTEFTEVLADNISVFSAGIKFVVEPDGDINRVKITCPFAVAPLWLQCDGSVEMLPQDIGFVDLLI